ncbi:hypothetical protein [Xylanivirga thermophila]|uniref:hypothetical protein n=1 Tax=Xylanivirga thermophila TaxID=2496273 RepID=UPI00101D2F67|nr:hypothetical protein [Xylanivirga thermophila]
MQDRDTLYIPLGLKERNEFWDGFGKEEAIKALTFIAFIGIVDALIYFSTRNIAFCAVLFLVSIGGSLMMLTKDTTNLSVVDQIKNMIRFLKSQKYYPYKYLDEWK